MKKTFLFLFTFFSSMLLYSQSITGPWNGVLKVPGGQLRVVFHIVKTDTGFSSTMDSPDQGAKGIPVTQTSFDGQNLKLEITAAQIEYTGQLKNDTITGVFKQRGQRFPMNLTREQTKKQPVKRPQEPHKPYPYYTEDVTFQNSDANITLSGTLTLPKKEGIYPVVILISGSGPQNRDEELMGHKPFLVISDYLTKKGIAVLRFDDRGTGQSTGNFKTATSADFASDAESAIGYLKTRKEIDKNKIGLLGHSEGGIIAPMIASKSRDVSFIVLLAGTGIRGDKLLLLQQESIAKASGISDVEIQKSREFNAKAFEMIVNSNDSLTLRNELTKYLKNLADNPGVKIPEGITKDEFVTMQVNQITSPWMVYFIRYDPTNALEKVKCPVLAINGQKDMQVAPKENLAAINNALKKGGNKDVTIIEFPGLNHLFQECTTGLPDEYASIEQTFSPIALTAISDWIIEQVK